MKKVIFIALLLTSTNLNGQSLSETTFDFWVGNWDLTWKAADGTIEKGKNNIVKTLDGKVIQENFEALEGSFKGYKGTSISVFNPQTKTWHQTWMDNQGGNINFTGETIGEKKIFKTAEIVQNGQKTVSRMVFYDFTDNGFTWDWESTTDGGSSWKLNWRINYKRAK